MSDFTLVQPSPTYSPGHERQRNRRIEEVIQRNNVALREQLYADFLPACLVSELPASTQAGVRGYVTDATAPAFATAVTGGGAVGVTVYFDGTIWRCG